MVGIGFFAPLPLALMIPFMAFQSMAMGEAFGKSYQYGKRKISSMSNEDFNKLTAAGLASEIMTDYNTQIPAVTTAVRNSSKFQSEIIQELGDIVRNLPADIIAGLVGQTTPAPPPQDTKDIHQTQFGITEVRKGSPDQRTEGVAKVEDDITKLKRQIQETYETYGLTEKSKRKLAMQRKQYQHALDLLTKQDEQSKRTAETSAKNRIREAQQVQYAKQLQNEPTAVKAIAKFTSRINDNMSKLSTLYNEYERKNTGARRKQLILAEIKRLKESNNKLAYDILAIRKRYQ